MSELLPYSLVLLFVTALLGPVVVRFARSRAGWILGIVPTLLCAAFIYTSFNPSFAEGSLVWNLAWFPALGVDLEFKLDGLAITMAVLITGVGSCILVYAGGYLSDHPQLGRFFLYLIAFMMAMLGLVLADNLLLLFVFWELTSITSYLLIGFKHEYAESRASALQALLVTGAGAMAMMVGFLLLYSICGTFNISEVNALGSVISTHPLYVVTIILVLGGAFTKSAQVPFHFWLPNAMAGPTPVSAYLHSATMVKAGIYLMARLNPAFSQDPLWGTLLSIFGGITLLTAVVLGLFQRDVKTVLAYTTLGVLGLLTMLIGVGTEYAIKAMIVFLFGHALYKATLFMVAGSIDHEAGTRDATLLRGLRHALPITAIAGLLAALSMSGVPPFFGFIGKELIYKSLLVGSDSILVLTTVAFVGNVLMMALALNVGVGPFWGKPSYESLPKNPHEAPSAMWIGPIFLSAAGLILGIYPTVLADHFLRLGVDSIVGSAHAPTTLKIELCNLVKLDVALLLSAVTVVSGIAVFFLRRRFWAIGPAVSETLRKFGAEAVYDILFANMVKTAKWVTRRLQTGHLHDYVFMITIMSTGLLLWAIVKFGGLDFTIGWSEIDLLIVALTAVMTVAALVAVASSTYITVLVALGVVGFGVAILFAYYGAPDLAITQLLVEVLTVTLFMFVILKLPALKHISRRATRLRDGLLAIVFGGLVTILLLKAVNIQFDHAISAQLADWSYVEAKGRNVVNVILVDFRALDTMGEIVVIAIAAIGIAALVKSGFRYRKESI